MLADSIEGSESEFDPVVEEAPPTVEYEPEQIGSGPYPADDVGCARRLADEWHESLMWIEAVRRWYVLPEDSSVWVWDERKEHVIKAMQTCAAQKTDWPDTKSLANLGKHVNALELAKPFLAGRLNDFDVSGWVLNTPSGAISLQTEAEPGLVGPVVGEGRYLMQTRVVPTEGGWDPSLTPGWVAHLALMCKGNVELMEFLRRLAGVTLLGDQNIKPHVCPQLNGLGRNGKGIFLQVLGWVYGGYALTASSRLLTSTEGAHTTEQAALRGKRLVSIEEIRRINASLLKDLIGGGVLSARFMRADNVEFPKTWTFWFNNNGTMSYSGGEQSDGLWERILTIDLGKGIPAAGRRDGVFEELKSEGPGVLAWALQGLREFQAGGLGVPAVVVEAGAVRRGDADPLEMFVDEFYERVGGEEKVLGSEFMSFYDSWCVARGERSGGLKAVFGELRGRLGFEVKKATGNKTWVYGLKSRGLMANSESWN